MSTAPEIRLHLFFAQESPKAVILRQGPSKLFRMVLWDRETDTFEDGQWLKHKVYVERCDLSPDGQHFLYFALDGRWSGLTDGSYTAISRPPYFTALALFPVGDTWSGGGRFLDNHLFVADGKKDVIGRAEGLVRLTRKAPDDKCPSGLWQPDGRCAKIGKAKARPASEEPDRTLPEYMSYRVSGSRLFRLRKDSVELIRDFADMAFERIRAPYDWRGEDNKEDTMAPWHPLDGDAR